jgi:hypothetical protein
MITVQREGKTLRLAFELSAVSTIFYFTYECPNDWSARLLWMAINKALAERIQAIRQEEYLAGIKDARGKKHNRRDWFGRGLDLGMKK